MLTRWEKLFSANFKPIVDLMLKEKGNMVIINDEVLLGEAKVSKPGDH